MNICGNFKQLLKTSHKEKKFEIEQDNSTGKKGARKKNRNKTDEIFASIAGYKLYE